MHSAMISIDRLTYELGLPADACERVARYTGALTAPDDVTWRGRAVPRWAGNGMDVLFFAGEAWTLAERWQRDARAIEAMSSDSGGTDPEIEALANRFRP